MSVLEESIGCGQAALLIAFPADEASFYRAKLSGDFCKKFATYAAYSKAVALDRSKQAFEHFSKISDLDVVWNARFSDLLDAMDQKRLIVLFAHQDEVLRQVEFLDEMVTAEELCRRLPVGWTGFLEASACFSETLVDTYRQKFGDHAKLGYVQCELRTRGWLEYYFCLFKALVSTELPLGNFLAQFDLQVRTVARREINQRSQREGMLR